MLHDKPTHATAVVLLCRKAEDTIAVNKRKIADLVEERADTEERQQKLRRLQDNKQR